MKQIQANLHMLAGKKTKPAKKLKQKPAYQEDRKPRSKSAGKHRFVKEGPHQDWTNTFSRMTVQWDEKYGLLDEEKVLIPRGRRLEKYPMRCCGNSPGKMHTKNCERGQPGYESFTTNASSSAAGKRKSSASKRTMKSSKRSMRRSASAMKRKPRPARASGGGQKNLEVQHMVQDMGGVDQALYNINANGQAVHFGESQDYSQDNNQRNQQIYYQDDSAAE